MVSFGKIFTPKPDAEILPISTAQSNSVADLHTKLFHRGWGAGECHSLIIQESVFGYYCRFAKKDNINGFVLLRVAADEAEVLSIGTEQSAQNSGVGWRMMQAAIGEAEKRGAEKIFLEVDESNLPALKLYRKIGFDTVGNRNAYYDNGEGQKSNALVLELKLN